MRFTLKLKAFPVTIGVWCGEWEKEAILQFARTISKDPQGVDEPEKNVVGLCYDFGLETLIWLPEEPSTPKQIGFLSHEAFHAAENIAKAIGIEHCKKSSEFYAYLTGYIVEETLKRCGKPLTSD